MPNQGLGSGCCRNMALVGIALVGIALVGIAGLSERSRIVAVRILASSDGIVILEQSVAVLVISLLVLAIVIGVAARVRLVLIVNTFLIGFVAFTFRVGLVAVAFGVGVLLVVVSIGIFRVLNDILRVQRPIGIHIRVVEKLLLLVLLQQLRRAIQNDSFQMPFFTVSWFGVILTSN